MMVRDGRLRLAARWVLIVAALAVVWPLSPSQAQARKETVVIGLAQEPEVLGPFTIMAVAGVIHNALYGYVSPFTDKWVRIPVMAEKLPTIKDGDWVVLPNKKMKVTWRLKRGFSWHDGRPVTALDWVFTYNMYRHPQTPQVSRFILSKVDNILIPNTSNPYTMVVQWNELFPFAGSTPYGDQYPHPRHVLQAAFRSDPSKLKAHPNWRAPVGHGPYRFVEWTPGSHITLEANEKFPLGAPAFKRLTFRFILDSTVLQANQIAGGVDGTEINNFGCLSMEQIEQRNPQIATHFREALTWERIDFNLDNEWLKDKRVRQAIGHAIDRTAAAKISCPSGKQPVAHAWLAPGHPASNRDVRKYAYDPARARALLAEAGFTMGSDGILRDSAGKRAEMTIMTTAGNSVREQVEQLIKENLKQVGIDLRIDNRPASVFLGVIAPRRQFPYLAMYASLFQPESLPFDRFHSSQIPSEQNSWEGNNRVGWRHAENDRIWEQIVSELDAGRRTALLKRQQEIFAEEVPSLSLYFRLDLTTTHKAIKNVKPTGLGTYYIPWNVYEWKWEQ